MKASISRCTERLRSVGRRHFFGGTPLDKACRSALAFVAAQVLLVDEVDECFEAFPGDMRALVRTALAGGFQGRRPQVRPSGYRSAKTLSRSQCSRRPSIGGACRLCAIGALAPSVKVH